MIAQTIGNQDFCAHQRRMNPSLQSIYDNHTGRLVRKFDHYLDAYSNHFERFRNTDVTILEIGVCDGGSLQIWREYFGPKARIIGVDLDPRCKAFADEGCEIFIGNQSDKNFLRRLKSQIPEIDILIDDGGHRMDQQISTFDILFDHVSDNGVYLCEDVYTSYWDTYGGGYKRSGTFIEHTKLLIDQLNAWHSRENELKVNDFTRNACSMHFYSGIVAIEKKSVQAPTENDKGSARTSQKDLAGEINAYEAEFQHCENPPIWMQIRYCNSLDQVNRGDEADKLFQQCLNNMERQTNAWLMRAQLSYRSGNMTLARKCINTVLTDEPDSSHALIVSADIHFETGELNESINALRLILDTNPSHHDAKARLNEQMKLQQAC